MTVLRSEEYSLGKLTAEQLLFADRLSIGLNDLTHEQFKVCMTSLFPGFYDVYQEALIKSQIYLNMSEVITIREKNYLYAMYSWIQLRHVLKQSVIDEYYVLLVGDDFVVNTKSFCEPMDSGHWQMPISLMFFVTEAKYNRNEYMYFEGEQSYFRTVSVQILLESIPLINQKLDTYKSKDKKSYKTYLMVDDSTGLYKIGKSKDPKYREGTFQSAKPTVRMLLTCDLNIETALHREYDDKRVRGEWFRLTPADVKNIESKFYSLN